MVDPQTASEGPKLFTVSSVVEQLEATYLFEYARFTGMFREYLVATLEQQFKREPNDLHRRAFVSVSIRRWGYTRSYSLRLRALQRRLTGRMSGRIRPSTEQQLDYACVAHAGGP